MGFWGHIWGPFWEGFLEVCFATYCKLWAEEVCFRGCSNVHGRFGVREEVKKGSKRGQNWVKMGLGVCPGGPKWVWGSGWRSKIGVFGGQNWGVPGRGFRGCLLGVYWKSWAEGICFIDCFRVHGRFRVREGVEKGSKRGQNWVLGVQNGVLGGSGT